MERNDPVPNNCDLYHSFAWSVFFAVISLMVLRQCHEINQLNDYTEHREQCHFALTRGVCLSIVTCEWKYIREIDREYCLTSISRSAETVTDLYIGMTLFFIIYKLCLVLQVNCDAVCTVHVVSIEFLFAILLGVMLIPSFTCGFGVMSNLELVFSFFIYLYQWFQYAWKLPFEWENNNPI